MAQRPDRRLHRVVREAADAHEGVAQVGLLGRALRLDRERAPRAAAADADEGAGRLDACGRGLHDAVGDGADERLLLAHDVRLDGVAGEAARDEGRLAFRRVREAVGPVYHAFDSELHLGSPVVLGRG